MKVYNTQVVMREFPDEISLVFNISGCLNHCPDCHSKYLWGDVGEKLDEQFIERAIKENSGITCIGFMGGDGSVQEVVRLAYYIRDNYDLRIGWYSGRYPEGNNIASVYDSEYDLYVFDYIKFGPYIAERGGLDNPNTNQFMLYNRQDGYWEDITSRFWNSSAK